MGVVRIVIFVCLERFADFKQFQQILSINYRRLLSTVYLLLSRISLPNKDLATYSVFERVCPTLPYRHFFVREATLLCGSEYDFTKKTPSIVITESPVYNKVILKL